MRRKILCEMFGTFCLVFAGTGAIVVNDVTSGLVTHVGVSFTFGLIVLAMIYSIGETSGAHMNPAVTVAFVIAGRLPGSAIFPYLSAQVAGAFLASFSIRLLFPFHPTLGATIPAESVWQSLVLEMFLTMILMFVILKVSTGAKEKSITAGIAVGSIVALEALFAGPISGASMNPARSIAPAVVSLQLQHSWIYVIAPIIGAMLAVPLARAMTSPDVISEYGPS